jgi:RNA polymerase sigma factor (TIGR02999 family)
MGDVTQLLERARDGDTGARDLLFTRIYAELQTLARQKLAKESTLTQLDAPSLVHEAYLRLSHQTELPGRNRRMFFAYAAHVMRSVIVDYVRNRNALRRGGAAEKIALVTGDQEAVFKDQQIDVLDSALRALQQVDARCHQIVEMRYFAGLTNEEIADFLELSPATVKRDWHKARTFLLHTLQA